MARQDLKIELLYLSKVMLKVPTCNKFVNGFVSCRKFWILSVMTAHVATTGTVMLAVLPLILGFQLILQAIVLDIQASPK